MNCGWNPIFDILSLRANESQLLLIVEVMTLLYTLDYRSHINHMNHYFSTFN